MHPSSSAAITLAAIALLSSSAAAQRTHYFNASGAGARFPAVDYDLDCDRDDTDLDMMELSLCGSDPIDWLYDFDLDGVCEYDETEDDWVLVNAGQDDASPPFTVYWCVTDQYDGGQTGEWNYQMDNGYAQETTTYGQTVVPSVVNRYVAIFYAHHFGFWPTFKIASGDRVGGLHCLLLPTPASTYDSSQYEGTWQYRIRGRFRGNGLDPDTDGATGDWLACWNHYMDLHYDRIHGTSPGAGAINELCGTGGVSGDFAGVGVIDFEHMHLTWDYETSDGIIDTPDTVPDQWRIVVADINSGMVDTNFLDFMDGTQWEFTPNYGGGIPGAWNSLLNKEELYESSYNCFMYYFIKQTLDACRDVSAGNATFGFWGLPKRTVTLDDTFDADMAGYHDELAWLWDDDLDDGVHVDMLLLSLYARHTTTVNGAGDCDACDGNPCGSPCANCSRPTEDYTDSARFYRANVAEMLYLRETYNSNLLVLPFVWRQYGNQARCQYNDVNSFVSNQQFLLPKFYGADGVMIWDDIDRSEYQTPGSPADLLQKLVTAGPVEGLWHQIITDHSCP
ncbi:MAG TPA: hypothetical protein VFF69_00040 [Phycisphaerales bacterium]|nr:hypothetical protein [Phycisphaerales bacterium]